MESKLQVTVTFFFIKKYSLVFGLIPLSKTNEEERFINPNGMERT